VTLTPILWAHHLAQPRDPRERRERREPGGGDLAAPRRQWM